MPREGHDAFLFFSCPLLSYFNPRAPRGARPTSKTLHKALHLFQSTCPARGTTQDVWSDYYHKAISIHVPREGHDGQCRFSAQSARLFQSTCPARGTTVSKQGLTNINSSNFNPRAPRGARRVIKRIAMLGPAFQSTCPARGTTLQAWDCQNQQKISIHVPREGHDAEQEINQLLASDFNPRAPRGARHSEQRGKGIDQHFNPRAPRGARHRRA